MNIIENITITGDITLISFHTSPVDINVISEIFGMIADKGIDVDMISQSPQNGKFSDLSFSVNDLDLVKVMEIAAKMRENYPELKLSISSGNCKLSVYGEKMNGAPGVAAKVFNAVAAQNSDIRMITTSDVTISMLVAQIDADKCVEAVKKAFA